MALNATVYVLCHFWFQSVIFVVCTSSIYLVGKSILSYLFYGEIGPETK